MDYKEVPPLINLIEKKFPVDQWEINSVKIWPLIRIKLHYILCYSSLGLNVDDSIQNRTNSQAVFQVIFGAIKCLFFSIINFRNNQILLKKRDLIFLGNGGNVKINDLWTDKFCDPLRNVLHEHKYTSLRLDVSHNYRTPRLGKSFFFQPLLDASIIWSMITFNKKNIRCNLPNYEDFLGFIEKNTSAKGDDFSKRIIFKQVHKVKTLQNLYKKIINRIKPLAVMTVCYYDTNCMAFNLACREAKIPSFDIQHGVQGEGHGAYFNWAKVPPQGYGLLPDYFICWGESERSTIVKWSKNLSIHKPIVVGNLFLEQWKTSTSEMSKPFIDTYTSTFNNYLPKILISLGWDFSSEEMIGETLSAIQKVENSYNWLIRLHPSMLHQKEQIIDLLKKYGVYNFEIDLASSFPLYFILNNVDCHVTHSSTVVIEAAEFGVHSILTSQYGWDIFFDDKYLQPFINKAFSSDGIVVALDSLVKNKSIKKQLNENSITSNKIDELMLAIKNN